MKKTEALKVIRSLISILLDVPVTCIEGSRRTEIDFKELTPPAFIMEKIRGPVFGDIFGTMKPGMIYHIIDRFKLQYSVIYDNGEDEGYFIIGPYRTKSFENEDNAVILHQNGMTEESYVNSLEWYYGLLPMVDSNKVQPCMTTIAEFLYPNRLKLKLP